MAIGEHWFNRCTIMADVKGVRVVRFPWLESWSYGGNQHFFRMLNDAGLSNRIP